MMKKLHFLVHNLYHLFCYQEIYRSSYFCVSVLVLNIPLVRLADLRFATVWGGEGQTKYKHLTQSVLYSISHLTSQNLSGRHEILMSIAQYNF